MAITLGATTTQNKITATATDGSFTHTVDASTDLLLCYIAVEGNENAPTTVSWDVAGVNEPLTQFYDTGDTDNNADCRGFWYGLVSPTAKTATLTITYQSSVNPAWTAACNYIGTDTTDLATATNTLSIDQNLAAGATNQSVHASAGTAGNALVYAGHFMGNDGTGITVPTDFTEIFDDTTGDSDTADFSAYYCHILSAAGATACTVTWSATDANSSAYIELVAAAGTNTDVNYQGSGRGIQRGIDRGIG